MNPNTTTYQSYFWERIPFFRLLLPLAIGIAAADLLYPTTINPYVCLVILLAAATGLALLARWYKPSLRLFYFVLTQVALIASGMGLYALAGYSPGANPSMPGGMSVVVVDAPPVAKPRTIKYVVQVLSSAGAAQYTAPNTKALLYATADSSYIQYAPGDTLLVPATWQPITDVANPFAFSYADYCRRSGICWQQFCHPLQVVRISRPLVHSMTYRISGSITKAINAAIPDARTAGLVQAMLLGREASLDINWRNDFSKTGILHIMAISGGNIIMFFSLVSALLLFVRHRKWLWVKYVIALPLIWAYIIMSGAQPSAVRAGIMFSLLTVTIGGNFQSHPINHLLATALVMLIAHPAWLLAPGFQLSFLAVLSILLFYKPIIKAFRRIAVPGSLALIADKIAQVIAVTLAAQVLVVPVSVYYFNTLPLAFIPANMLATIYMACMMCLSILLLLAAAYAPLAMAVGGLMHHLTHLFTTANAALAAVSPQALSNIYLPMPAMLGIYVIIVLLMLAWHTRRKPYIYSAAAVLVVLLLSQLAYYAYTAHNHKLIVYNTGRISRIEAIHAHTFTTLRIDTTANNYDAARQPHIVWQAWQETPQYANETIQVIHGQSVMLLLAPPHPSAPLAIDHLIIALHGNYKPETLLRHINPKHIILADRPSARTLTRWTTFCTQHHIPLHIISRDGAWVME